MKRNKRIYELVLKGRAMEQAERIKKKLTLELIGEKYGVSKQCIGQIFFKVKKAIDKSKKVC